MDPLSPTLLVTCLCGGLFAFVPIVSAVHNVFSEFPLLSDCVMDISRISIMFHTVCTVFGRYLHSVSSVPPPALTQLDANFDEFRSSKKQVSNAFVLQGSLEEKPPLKWPFLSRFTFPGANAFDTCIKGPLKHPPLTKTPPRALPNIPRKMAKTHPP